MLQTCNQKLLGSNLSWDTAAATRQQHGKQQQRINIHTTIQDMVFSMRPLLGNNMLTTCSWQQMNANSEKATGGGVFYVVHAKVINIYIVMCMGYFTNK
jgi:hypothetical protein